MSQQAVTRPRPHTAAAESVHHIKEAPHLRSTASRLRALDALRLLAALSVGVYHYLAFEGAEDAWAQAPASVFPHWTGIAAYGWLGVEIFFVISGLVICMSCWGRTLGDFFRSRVVRLYPAYWAAVLLTYIVVTLTPAIAKGIPLSTVLVNLTMLQDPIGVDRVDGVYWTLWAEMRFYLLFALVVWRGLTFRRVVAFSMIWTVTAAIARTAGSDLLFMIAMPKYAHYFLVGIGLYLIHRFGHNLMSWLIVGVNAALAFHYAGLRMDHQVDDIIHQPLSRAVVALILFGGMALVYAIARGHLGLGPLAVGQLRRSPHLPVLPAPRPHRLRSDLLALPAGRPLGLCRAADHPRGDASAGMACSPVRGAPLGRLAQGPTCRRRSDPGPPSPDTDDRAGPVMRPTGRPQAM